ncbi:MAG: hypothetical protein ACSHWW_10645 [Nonlabens sp.]|uniref:hypothetical protein n=1 Tax=Nonlabens sp. TaxID=1888209 RepID=UPI003EF432A0
MDIQKWLNDQNIEAVQDRRDGKDYWMYDNLYTEIDLIELLEAFSLHVVVESACDNYLDGINMQCASCDQPKYKQ